MMTMKMMNEVVAGTDYDDVSGDGVDHDDKSSC